uniref:Prothymosin alpha n=1 Tax=Urocitellus parryii TaxID=9999 RepID=A0A8D2KD45_UROPR
MSDAAVDTSSEITTKGLKEKKEVVEEAENGRDAPANGDKRMEMKMRLRQLRANG